VLQHQRPNWRKIIRKDKNSSGLYKIGKVFDGLLIGWLVYDMKQHIHRRNRIKSAALKRQWQWLANIQCVKFLSWKRYL
jgi:hypothetical protein